MPWTSPLLASAPRARGSEASPRLPSASSQPPLAGILAGLLFRLTNFEEFATKEEVEAAPEQFLVRHSLFADPDVDQHAYHAHHAPQKFVPSRRHSIACAPPTRAGAPSLGIILERGPHERGPHSNTV